MEIHEARHAGAHLSYEVHPDLCREAATITGVAAEPGHVLGQITATGKFTTYNPANGDGSERPVAVLYEPVDASGADQTAIIHRRLTVVQRNLLTWFAGATDAQIATGVAELAQQNIIAR